MGTDQYFFNWIGSGQPSLGLEDFPLKIQIWGRRSLIGLDQKIPRSKQDRPLIYCESKVCSGHYPSLILPIERWSQWSSRNLFPSDRNISSSSIDWCNELAGSITCCSSNSAVSPGDIISVDFCNTHLTIGSWDPAMNQYCLWLWVLGVKSWQILLPLSTTSQACNVNICSSSRPSICYLGRNGGWIPAHLGITFQSILNFKNFATLFLARRTYTIELKLKHTCR